MKKLNLIKNQELFQGENSLKKEKVYFEGWYFKNTNHHCSISFIPGISITDKEAKAFIQIITDDSSFFVDYKIEDFIFHHNPFYIKIKDNYFSLNKICINIYDEQQNVNIHGKLKYSDQINIKTSVFFPNIMGPFSYVSFMECNHAILAMRNNIRGVIHINNKNIKFHDGIGYIEKDWGSSFPKTYLWCQANCFKHQKVNFMFSKADIPFKLFHFQGFICVLIVDNKEYKFTTYNKSKLITCEINDDFINIVIKKGNLELNIQSFPKNGHKLSAPVNGKMCKVILETISATILITLKKIIKFFFSDESTHCGLEIVN